MLDLILEGGSVVFLEGGQVVFLEEVRGADRGAKMPVVRRHANALVRRGITLLELLLVLALLVAVAALAAPTLRNAFASRHLRLAAEHVRSVWARARNQAILQGEPRAFTYQPLTGNYKVEPYTGPPPATTAMTADSVSPTAQSISSQSSADEAATNLGTSTGTIQATLPGEMLFSPPSIGGAQAMSFGTGTPETTSAADAATGLASQPWSEPILFFPDGTTSDARVDLQGANGRQAAITLRSLTGQSQLLDDAGEAP